MLLFQNKSSPFSKKFLVFFKTPLKKEKIFFEKGEDFVVALKAQKASQIYQNLLLAYNADHDVTFTK